MIRIFTVNCVHSIAVRLFLMIVAFSCCPHRSLPVASLASLLVFSFSIRSLSCRSNNVSKVWCYVLSFNGHHKNFSYIFIIMNLTRNYRTLQCLCSLCAIVEYESHFVTFIRVDFLFAKRYWVSLNVRWTNKERENRKKSHYNKRMNAVIVVDVLHWDKHMPTICRKRKHISQLRNNLFATK